MEENKPLVCLQIIIYLYEGFVYDRMGFKHHARCTDCDVF